MPVISGTLEARHLSNTDNTTPLETRHLRNTDHTTTCTLETYPLSNTDISTRVLNSQRMVLFVSFILMSFRDMQALFPLLTYAACHLRDTDHTSPLYFNVLSRHALFPLLTYAACHLRNTDHTTAMKTRHHSNTDHTTPFDAYYLRNTDHTTLLEACTSGTLTIKLHWRPVTSGSGTLTIRVH